MLNLCSRVLFILLTLFPGIGIAAPNPKINLSGTVLRLVMQSGSDGTESVRSVEIVGEGPIRVSWEGLSREPVGTDPFPHYKIVHVRGIMQLAGIAGSTLFFHPAFWGRGFVKLENASPLWLDPLLLSSGKDLTLDLGLIKPGRLVQQLAPDDLFEQIAAFNKLYDFYLPDGKPAVDQKLTDAQRKALREFARDWPQVSTIAQTRVELVVNKKPLKLDARILGNEYFQLVVLDDPHNPLVVSLRLFADKVPQPFRKVFEFFKGRMEYQVTQVNQ